jgi:predicted ATPase/class 3 adenylate cyclase/Tfp pilus assembly protein PilF
MPAPPDLRALLLTDVVDSTKLTEELGDAAMAELWTVHDRIARDLLPLWRGREIDKTDGMLLLFAYHRALAARELPFKARAGIHVGPVSLRPNPPDDVARGAKPVEVDGLALPIAARVMSVSMGAQTLLSADARLALGVAAQRVMSHGHWRMHGVSDPVELFEVGEVGAGSTAPFKAPPDGAKVYRVMRQGELWQPVREVRHSVPAERDSFVGRQEPLALLAKKFEDGARLVSVLGMGGTGKTRLVTRFAWTVLGDYPGGVWFCDLSQARTVDGIHFAVAQGLDVPLGKTEPVVQLAHAIAGRGRCLVILDNFEQVARLAEETLGRWLDRAQFAHFLVTTREVLGIVGEETLALAPLPMLDAAALFLRRAGSGRQGYAPGADDLLAIDQLVKVLDGLPLAIELAAARVRVMPPRMLLARMNERFNVLLSRAGRRDRQATLRAAFDWSWELLSEAEKTALAQLSVFEGGFTLDTAEAVLELTTPGGRAEPVDVVHWLVDKSFVRQLAHDRFDLLESVREYAGEHLRTADRYDGSGPQAHDAAERRHGAFFARIASQKVTAARCAELDNVVAACRRAAARGDGETAALALDNAWVGLKLHGPFRVGLELATKVRAVSALSEAALITLDAVNGKAALAIGDMAQARLRLEAAAARAAAAGSAFEEARALCALAELHVHEGRFDAGHACFEATLAKAGSSADAAFRCGVLTGLGVCAECVGDVTAAQTHFQRVLDIARQAGDRRWEGGALGNLGQLDANQGRLDRARLQYERALGIAQEIGDRQWEGNVSCNLGLLHQVQGRMDEALPLLESALAIARQLGHARLEAVVLCNLGIAQVGLGQHDRAGESYRSALQIARDLGDRRSEGQFLGYLAQLLARQNDLGAARQCVRLGLGLMRELSDQISLGLLLCIQAEIEFRAGDRDAWRAALEEAEELAAQRGIEPSSEFGVALGHARALPATAQDVSA